MKLASRKLHLMIALQVMSVFMLLQGKVDGGQFVNLTEWIWAAYIAGNVGEHLANRE